MIYHYKGFKQGKKIKGQIEAEDETQARKELRSQRIIITAIKTKVKKTKEVRQRSRFEVLLSPIFIGSGEIEECFRQLYIMLKGDITVVDAIELVQDLSKGMLQQALMETALMVRAGNSLADSLRTNMPFLGSFTLELIALGEVNGTLPEMFEFAIEVIHRKRDIKNKVLEAATYPAVVVVMGLGVGYYVTAVAIPKIAKILGENNQALPPITKALLVSSAWVTDNAITIIIAPIVMWFCYMFMRKIDIFKLLTDRVALMIPVVGKVISFSSNTLWNRNLATLIRSGVNIVEAIELTRNTMNNSYYKKQFEIINNFVTEGKSISSGIKATALVKLSRMSVAMITIGENSGRIDEGLNYVSDYYSEALDRKLDLMAKLVEPALIVVVGGMVAFVYVAFFMGMAAMNQ